MNLEAVTTLNSELEKKIRSRYTKLLAEYSKNVKPIPLIQENGKSYYEVPEVVIQGNPFTVVDFNADATLLANTATASVVLVKKKPLHIATRVLIDYNEAQIALKDDSYFNHFFDGVINDIVNKLATKIGRPELLRHGDTYFTILSVIDDGNGILLTFVTMYASTENL